MPIDYSKYPKNWKEIRARILERAQNKCEVCNVPNHIFVLRGTWEGKDAYQLENGFIYSAEDGMLLKDDSGEFEEVNCKPRQKATKIILTIAHLDHDAENHDVADERLKAMCQKCHLGYDMANHVAKRKAGIKKKKGLIEIDFEPKNQ